MGKKLSRVNGLLPSLPCWLLRFVMVPKLETPPVIVPVLVSVVIVLRFSMPVKLPEIMRLLVSVVIVPKFTMPAKLPEIVPLLVIVVTVPRFMMPMPFVVIETPLLTVKLHS